MLGADWFGRATGSDAAAARIVVLVVAAIVGSFLGVVIRRLPERRPIAWDRSRCEGCGAALGIRDLVPLLSWLGLRGRCRFCNAPIGWFYPAVELASLAIAVVAVTIDRGAETWLDCILGWWLLALGWIDARHWQLPDLLTLPLVVAGLAAALAFDPSGLTDRALGAALGYLALRVVAYLYRKFRGRDGLGGGDAKLLAAAGAWVGASGLPQVVLISALAGLFAAACLRLAGVRLTAASPLPFGPFLALATWLVWLLPAL
ncbi:MAG TPA: A24 family peptidase [Stellaceae bacterium]|nr:A24 family peptidase [Stellaceae bacterium]